MSRARLSEELNRLLPGEQWKRVREGILAAANYSGQRTDQLRQNIDEANRLKTGVLVNGTVDFTSTTNADLSGFAWVIDYQIFQQTAAESITVNAPDADFPRPDIFVGLDDGSIEYRAGTVDEEGNAQDPSYDPLTEVLLRAVTRNPDNSNDEVDPGEGGSDFVSKSAPGNQTIQSSITLSSLSDPNNPSNLIQIDTNGKIVIVRADRIGSFATRNLAVGFSRLARINTVVSGGPAIRDYQFKLDILATLDGDVTQRGELYCALINDGTGTYVSSVLEVTGDLNPAVFKLVKVSATEYDLFYEHLDTKAILIYRPFALGPADRYIFYRRETILASLPAGVQYSFSEAGGGTSLDADIVDALEGANAPDAGNPFATIDDIPIVPEDFIDLLDTPNGYTGQGGKKVKVKSDETGLEFVDDTGGGGRDDDAVHYDAADGKSASEKQQARDNIGSDAGIPQIISSTGVINSLVRTSNCIIFTGAANVDLRGISAGENGEKCTIINLQSAGATVYLRPVGTAGFGVADGITLQYRQIARLIYSTSINRWILENEFKDGWSFLTPGEFTMIGNTSFNTTNKIVFRGTGHPSLIYSVVWGNATTIYGGIRSGGNIRTPRAVQATDVVTRDEKNLYNDQGTGASGTLNDYNLLPENGLVRFTAAPTLTGVTNGENGREIVIFNDNNSPMSVKDEDSGSVAANRFNLGGSDFTIQPRQYKKFIYYGSRWRIES